MRLVSLSSGSSGNCLYVGTDNTHILIDAGVPAKRVIGGLNEIGLSLDDIDAILVTHEHSDHIGGLGVLTRKRPIPIYSTLGTKQGTFMQSCSKGLDETLFNIIQSEEMFTLGDITIDPIAISHDAAEPVAYQLTSGNKKIGIATDLGVYDDKIINKLQYADVLFLESNHDVRMLQVGPYPYQLKQRILGDRGHLSNENCGRLLSKLLHDNTKSVMLGHLSDKNNLPELAFETVKLEVTMSETPYEGGDFPIYVAKRSEVSKELVC